MKRRLDDFGSGKVGGGDTQMKGGLDFKGGLKKLRGEEDFLFKIL